MQHLWVASSNQGKLSEFKSLLAGFQIHSPQELAIYSYPKETGKTFEENARLKARSLRALKKDTWVVGEDSGLEVEGLDGLPGIFSARYAGDKASDGENNAKLLKMVQIRTPENRKARFRCVLVAYSPNGQELVLEGVLQGEIAQQSRGATGFGYDPIFVPEGFQTTLAEMGPQKNSISHRAQVVKKLREVLGTDVL